MPPSRRASDGKTPKWAGVLSSSRQTARKSCSGTGSAESTTPGPEPFSQSDLERRAARAANPGIDPLRNIAIDQRIAGRDYQQECVETRAAKSVSAGASCW